MVCEDSTKRGTYIRRREFGVLAIGTLIGCQEEGGGDPEFNEDVDPDGTVSVRNQEGQGWEIQIDSAQANVEYRIVIEHESGTIESDPISANQEVSPTIELDTQLREEQELEVSLLSTDGAELATGSFQYTIVPPGPRLTAEDAQEILADRVGLLGAWTHFKRWARDKPVIERDIDGYYVTTVWVQDHFIAGSESTERYVARANAAFCQALYQSEFEIKEVELETLQHMGTDTVGDPITEPLSRVVVTKESAEQVDWDNLLNHGDFPEGLRQVADEYEFTYNYE